MDKRRGARALSSSGWIQKEQKDPLGKWEELLRVIGLWLLLLGAPEVSGLLDCKGVVGVRGIAYPPEDSLTGKWLPEARRGGKEGFVGNPLAKVG